MSPLAEKLAAELRAHPRQFSELVDGHRETAWPDFLRAWGEVRGLRELTRDDDGRYVLQASVPPS